MFEVIGFNNFYFFFKLERKTKMSCGFLFVSFVLNFAFRLMGQLFSSVHAATFFVLV